MRAKQRRTFGNLNREIAMRRAIAQAVVIALGVVACESRRAPQEQSKTVRQQGAVEAAAPVTYERPLAFRREMQSVLDSARLLLARGDTADVASLLHRAGAFLLVQANAPSNGGSSEMVAAAAGLDSLAGHLPARTTAALHTIDALSARANLAEAERHAARAGDAWARHTRQAVADELLMTDDHIRRASRDVGNTLSPQTERTLAEVRQIVTQLPTRRELEPDALDEVLNALHQDILTMRSKIR
jgi:hypothetical protein